MTPDPGTCRQVPPSQERWAPFPTGVYGAVLLAPGTPRFPFPTLRRETCRPSGHHPGALLSTTRAFSGVPSASRRVREESRSAGIDLDALPCMISPAHGLAPDAMDRRTKDGGDILTEALWRSKRARFPVRKDGESETGRGAELTRWANSASSGRMSLSPSKAIPGGEPRTMALSRQRG